MIWKPQIYSLVASEIRRPGFGYGFIPVAANASRSAERFVGKRRQPNPWWSADCASWFKEAVQNIFEKFCFRLAPAAAQWQNRRWTFFVAFASKAAWMKMRFPIRLLCAGPFN